MIEGIGHALLPGSFGDQRPGVPGQGQRDKVIPVALHRFAAADDGKVKGGVAHQGCGGRNRGLLFGRGRLHVLNGQGGRQATFGADSAFPLRLKDIPALGLHRQGGFHSLDILLRQGGGLGGIQGLVGRGGPCGHEALPYVDGDFILRHPIRQQGVVSGNADMDGVLPVGQVGFPVAGEDQAAPVIAHRGLVLVLGVKRGQVDALQGGLLRPLQGDPGGALGFGDQRPGQIQPHAGVFHVIADQGILGLQGRIKGGKIQI